MIHSYKEFSPEFNATVNAFLDNPPASSRPFHNVAFRIIPDSLLAKLGRATPATKSKQIKIRNVDMAGGKFVRIAFGDQLSQAG